MKRINKVSATSSPVSTVGGSVIPVFSRLFRPNHIGYTYGDGFGRRWGRNGEFCVAVGPIAKTADILACCMLA